MNIDTAIMPDAASQDQTVERLRRGADITKKVFSESKQKEIKKVAKDFEALFINMMMKSMRQTVPEDKKMGGGKGEETYRFLLDQEYANSASQRGGVGIASMIEQELTKRYSNGGLAPVPSKTVKAGDKDVK